MKDMIFAKIFVLERLTIFITFFCPSFLQMGTKLTDIMADENTPPHFSSEDSRKVEFSQMGYDVDMRRPISDEVRTLRVLHDSSSQARESPLTSVQKEAGPAASQSRPGAYNNWECQPLVGTGAESINTRCANGEYHPLTTPISPTKEAESMRVPVLRPLTLNNEYNEVPTVLAATPWSDINQGYLSYDNALLQPWVGSNGYDYNYNGDDYAYYF